MKKQQGISFYGMCFAIVLAVFFGLLAVKLSPIYLEHSLLSAAIEKSLEGSADKSSVSDLKERLNKAMIIDNITGPAKNAIKISKEDGNLVVTAEYEVRVAIVYNIDAVVSFNDRYGD